MTPQLFGTWALIVLGGIVVLAGLVRMFMRDPKLQMILACFVFGVLMSGVGTYGLGFVDKYTEFLKTTQILTALVEAPSDTTYAQATAAIASGKIDPAVSHVALAYMAARPTDRFKNVLQAAESKTKNKSVSMELAATQADIKARETAAAELTQSLAAKNQLTEEKVKSLDASTKIYVAHTLKTSPQVAPQHPLSPEVIHELSLPQAKPLSTMKTVKPLQP